MYNIPQSLLDRVKRAMKMEEEDFKTYLSSLETEAGVYVKNLLYVDFNSLDEENRKIFISFYLQYALYSKIEKDEISQDKLDFLHTYINGFNERVEKLEKDKINKQTGGGVTFL